MLGGSPSTPFMSINELKEYLKYLDSHFRDIYGRFCYASACAPTNWDVERFEHSRRQRHELHELEHEVDEIKMEIDIVKIKYQNRKARNRRKLRKYYFNLKNTLNIHLPNDLTGLCLSYS